MKFEKDLSKFCAIKMTDKAKKDLKAFLNKNLKNKLIEDNFYIVVDECLEKIGNGNFGYELGKHETKSGQPEVFDMDDDSFEWEEIEE